MENFSLGEKLSGDEINVWYKELSGFFDGNEELTEELEKAFKNSKEGDASFLKALYESWAINDDSRRKEKTEEIIRELDSKVDKLWDLQIKGKLNMPIEIILIDYYIEKCKEYNIEQNKEIIKSFLYNKGLDEKVYNKYYK